MKTSCADWSSRDAREASAPHDSFRIADLVLLDANPLEDICNKERISAVILGGKLLRRPDLDLLLRQAEEMA